MLAIVSNSLPPYRLHLHNRIVAELPEFRLRTILTHEIGSAAWRVAPPAEIGLVQFGSGEHSDDQDKLSHALREWKRGGRIVQLLKRERVGFLVMQGYNDPGRVRVIRWCKAHGVPCFLFGDSNIAGDTATGWKRLAKKLVVTQAVRSSAGVLACGSRGEAYFAKYGASADRTFLFPYEPDYQLIENLPTQTLAATRTRFSLSPERRRLVYSGRFIAVKRVDLLLRSFLAIAADRPAWDLVLVGDGLLRPDLQAMVPPELTSRVICTGFLDDQAEISAIYRLSDVLVLPSDFEPWALVVLEAAAAGMAVVCSDVVGVAAEVVRDGVNGRLFPPGNEAALTHCLRDVTDPQRIDAMKAASAPLLADWRRRGDPIAGLRAAMASVGFLATRNANVDLGGFCSPLPPGEGKGGVI